METAFELISQHAWWALAALVIGAIVRLLKSDTPLPFSVPPPARVWLALGLGISAGVCDKLASDTPWEQALIGGLLAALTAIAGHDTIVESARGGREFFERKKSVMRPDPATIGNAERCIPPPGAKRGCASVEIILLSVFTVASGILIGFLLQVGCAQGVPPKVVGPVLTLAECVLDELFVKGVHDVATIAVDCKTDAASVFVTLLESKSPEVHATPAYQEASRLRAMFARERGEP